MRHVREMCNKMTLQKPWKEQSLRAGKGRAGIDALPAPNLLYASIHMRWTSMHEVGHETAHHAAMIRRGMREVVGMGWG